ncbi:hypothetical protein BGZ83_012200, partial [Gryganskiella cystojenkinii]
MIPDTWPPEVLQVLYTLHTHILDPLESILNSIPWPIISKTRLYTLITAPSPSPLLPPHIVISNNQFLFLIFGAGIALYSMLITPFLRTTRVKQILAFPLLVTLLAVPLVFTCPLKLIHFGMAVTAAAVGQRMVDLYYVQPWTGVRTRSYPVPRSIQHNDRHRDQQKVSSSSNINGSITSQTQVGVKKRRLSIVNSKSNGNGHVHNFHSQDKKDPWHGVVFENPETFLNWDKNRFLTEMWLPLRKFSRSTSSSSSLSANASSHYDRPSPRYIPGRDIFLQCLIYKSLMDWILYFLSAYTHEDIIAFPLSRYAGFIGLCGLFVMVMVLWVAYSIALIYSACQKDVEKPLDLKEWTMLTTYMPCFATSPVEFWTNWQTLFRYIWVDLGFLPVHRLCRKHLTPKRVGSMMAKIAEGVLPILAVFTLSGLLHAYIVYAIWRENGFGQLVYFLIQGVAVVLTRMLERSRMGCWVMERRKEARWKRLVTDFVGWWMM